MLIRSVEAPPQSRDPSSKANYHEFLTTHTAVGFSVDFKRRKLIGDVVLRLKCMKPADEIILDTSYLDINRVSVDDVITSNWRLEERSEPLGSPLHVKLDKKAVVGEEVVLSVNLKTTDQCTALQWLTPAQTANGKHPYVFSQCQAIHARSLFPCQDTPDVKCTYEFLIFSYLPVLASGLSSGPRSFQHGDGEELGKLGYSFVQNVPIPSYLFAIASGDLASASIGPRSTIWTGPEQLAGAKWELEEDMENFINVAESLVFPYAWTTYNVLVLPPSFPYGGMENPVYTFATPTIISGDRQNIDVIAHELSHSWSGNLVSCCSWEHFWLNEGWTTYLERRIQGVIHGQTFEDFSAVIGWKALTDSIKKFGEEDEFTKMVPDLQGKDPDDAFSSVPYEKGYVFLRYLESVVGRSKWDFFIPHYFTKFRGKSLDTEQFKSTLLDFFEKDQDAYEALKQVNWNSWLFKPGAPPQPHYDQSLVKVCYDLASKWEKLSTSSLSSFKPQNSDIDGWSSNQIVVFLERIQELQHPLKGSLVGTMGDVYNFAQSKNVEIVSRYFVVGLMSKYEGVYKPASELLGEIGRMKFVSPLYRYLEKADHDLAIATFEKYKERYHPICRKMVEKVLFS